MMDTEKLKCQEVEDATGLDKIISKLKDAKLIDGEVVTYGGSDKDIRGMNLQFVLSNGEMVAIETYPNESEPDKLMVNAYWDEELGNLSAPT